MASILADQPPAGIFDASAWLTEWTENGGIYFLSGDMLHLRRTRPLDPHATSRLDRLRDEMLRAGGGPAVGKLLLQRREGEVRL